MSPAGGYSLTALHEYFGDVLTPYCPLRRGRIYDRTQHSQSPTAVISRMKGVQATDPELGERGKRACGEPQHLKTLEAASGSELTSSSLWIASVNLSFYRSESGGVSGPRWRRL